MNKDVKEVEALGNRIGYGHLMNIASALWRKSLIDKAYPVMGAFYPTCICFIKKKHRPRLVELEIYDKLIKS